MPLPRYQKFGEGIGKRGLSSRDVKETVVPDPDRAALRICSLAKWERDSGAIVALLHHPQASVPQQHRSNIEAEGRTIDLLDRAVHFPKVPSQ